MPAEAELQSWLSTQTWPDLRLELSTHRESPYRHPYGFVVVRLSKVEFPGWAIRLHIWPTLSDYDEYGRSLGSIDQRIHSHGWDIVTKTLVGSVEQKIFQIDSTQSGEYCSYEVTSDWTVGYSFLRHQECGLFPILIGTEERTAEDDLLMIPRHGFHETSPTSDEGLSLTLAATEHVQVNSSLVLVGHHSSSTIVNERAPVVGLDSMATALDDRYCQEIGGNDKWAAFVFFVKSGQVLLVRTCRNPHLWQPVGGQAAARDTDPLDTALREVEEETGLQVAESQLAFLGERPRDRGFGSVFAWTTPLRNEPRFQYEELAEVRWFSLPEALALPTFAATNDFLHTMLDNRPTG